MLEINCWCKRLTIKIWEKNNRYAQGEKVLKYNAYEISQKWNNMFGFFLQNLNYETFQNLYMFGKKSGLFPMKERLFWYGDIELLCMSHWSESFQCE